MCRRALELTRRMREGMLAIARESSGASFTQPPIHLKHCTKTAFDIHLGNPRSQESGPAKAP